MLVFFLLFNLKWLYYCNVEYWASVFGQLRFISHIICVTLWRLLELLKIIQFHCIVVFTNDRKDHATLWYASPCCAKLFISLCYVSDVLVWNLGRGLINGGHHLSRTGLWTFKLYWDVLLKTQQTREHFKMHYIITTPTIRPKNWMVSRSIVFGCSSFIRLTRHSRPNWWCRLMGGVYHSTLDNSVLGV